MMAEKIEKRMKENLAGVLVALMVTMGAIIGCVFSVQGTLRTNDRTVTDVVSYRSWVWCFLSIQGARVAIVFA
jgi:hypothetical protein